MKAPHDRSATSVVVWLIMTRVFAPLSPLELATTSPRTCAVPLLLKSRNAVENPFPLGELRRSPRKAMAEARAEHREKLQGVEKLGPGVNSSCWFCLVIACSKWF